MICSSASSGSDWSDVSIDAGGPPRSARPGRWHRSKSTFSGHPPTPSAVETRRKTMTQYYSPASRSSVIHKSFSGHQRKSSFSRFDPLKDSDLPRREGKTSLCADVELFVSGVEHKSISAQGDDSATGWKAKISSAVSVFRGRRSASQKLTRNDEFTESTQMFDDGAGQVGVDFGIRGGSSAYVQSSIGKDNESLGIPRSRPRGPRRVTIGTTLTRRKENHAAPFSPDPQEHTEHNVDSTSIDLMLHEVKRRKSPFSSKFHSMYESVVGNSSSHTAPRSTQDSKLLSVPSQEYRSQVTFVGSYVAPYAVQRSSTGAQLLCQSNDYDTDYLDAKRLSSAPPLLNNMLTADTLLQVHDCQDESLTRRGKILLSQSMSGTPRSETGVRWAQSESFEEDGPTSINQKGVREDNVEWKSIFNTEILEMEKNKREAQKNASRLWRRHSDKSPLGSNSGLTPSTNYGSTSAYSPSTVASLRDRREMIPEIPATPLVLSEVGSIQVQNAPVMAEEAALPLWTQRISQLQSCQQDGTPMSADTPPPSNIWGSPSAEILCDKLEHVRGNCFDTEASATHQSVWTSLPSTPRWARLKSSGGVESVPFDSLQLDMEHLMKSVSPRVLMQLHETDRSENQSSFSLSSSMFPKMSDSEDENIIWDELTPRASTETSFSPQASPRTPEAMQRPAIAFNKSRVNADAVKGGATVDPHSKRVHGKKNAFSRMSRSPTTPSEESVSSFLEGPDSVLSLPESWS